MNASLRTTLTSAGVPLAVRAAAQVTFYEQYGSGGRSLPTWRRVDNFGRHGFDDRASSAEVLGDRWVECLGLSDAW